MKTETSGSRRLPMPHARILVADALSPRGLEILQESGLKAESRTGLSEAQLCEIIGAYEGLIVRSATQVTARVIEAGAKLQVIGRAGVGVDNIDLKAATNQGIVVQNTPFGNITSAAEHTLALLFASARHVARADREIKAGQWPKKGLTGVELTRKTLGIVGLGKVGSIVARVAKALEMEILVYDPYLTEKKAEDLDVSKCGLDDLLARADFVTIHSPLTPETKGLLGKARLAKMKKSARLVNAARGGIVNEADLAEALRAGALAGAGLDVFETEPLPADSPLRALGNLVLTPHLGASTAEAQERVAEDIAKQFVDFFRDGVIRNAVNISVIFDPQLAPYARLAELLGSMAAQMARGAVRTLKVGCYGKLALGETKPLSLCALKGVLARTTGTPVTLVNAPVIAETRGIELIEHQAEKSPNYANLLVVAVESDAGEHTLGGTCFDDRQARIVRIDDFDIDLKPAAHILLMFYPDQPGMVGKFGTILGEADINIASMAVGRREKRGQAVVALTLDDPVTPEVVARLQKAARIDELDSIELRS